MATGRKVAVDSFGVYQLDVAHFEWRPNGKQGAQGGAMADPVREGGCHCGKLRYRITGEPVGVTVCHCADCQRQSGSAFSMSMIVSKDAFEWLAGEPACFAMKADSGADKDCLFCASCGVRILNRLGRMPDTVNVKPGTLDDTSWLAPKLHVWTRNKQPWVEVPAGVASFEANPKRGS